MRPPQRQLAQPGRISAPNGGMNAIDGLFDLNPKFNIFSYNLIPTQYGLKVRSGYQEWCTNLTGTGGVRTIIPVKGQPEAGTHDYLFAATSGGVYDVSSSSNAPTKVVTFADTTGNAGWGSWTNFTTVAGQYILHCDEMNGYRHFKPATPAWTEIAAGVGAGDINGADPTDFSFVVAHKGRLWFILRDSTLSYYLPAGQLTGTVTEFDWGNKFKMGGSLAALYSYTVDGGSGIDDLLIGVSTAGDVVVFQGDDPDFASEWSQRGSWYIGTPPVGRRIADSFGGDLILLSVFGAIPFSRLMAGTDKMDESAYLTRNISILINGEMQELRTDHGWEIKTNPTDSTIIIAVPKQTGSDWKQYVFHTGTRGWAILKDLPFQTGDTWKGILYSGTDDGRVMICTGTTDGADLDGLGAVAIEFSLLTAFSELGAGGLHKMMNFVRPYFLANTDPSYTVKVKYDFDLTDITNTAVILPPTDGPIWDVALWDGAIWGGTFASPSIETRGTADMGVHAAIAMRGTSSVSTTLLGFDFTFQSGGFL